MSSNNKENPTQMSAVETNNSSVNPHSVGCFVWMGLVLVLVSYISEKQLIPFKCENINLRSFIHRKHFICR